MWDNTLLLLYSLQNYMVSTIGRRRFFTADNKAILIFIIMPLLSSSHIFYVREEMDKIYY